MSRFALLTFCVLLNLFFPNLCQAKVKACSPGGQGFQPASCFFSQSFGALLESMIHKPGVLDPKVVETPSGPQNFLPVVMLADLFHLWQVAGNGDTTEQLMALESIEGKLKNHSYFLPVCRALAMKVVYDIGAGGESMVRNQSAELLGLFSHFPVLRGNLNPFAFLESFVPANFPLAVIAIAGSKHLASLPPAPILPKDWEKEEADQALEGLDRLASL